MTHGQGIMDGWGGWGGMLFGPLFMLFILVLFIYLIVVLVRNLSGGGGPATHASPGNSALDILQQRYARGEIDTAEYETRRKTLQETKE